MSPHNSERRNNPISSKLIADHPKITTIDELLALSLLHDSAVEGDGSLPDWRSWLDQLGRKDLPCHAGQRFSNAALLVEASVLGLGVAPSRFSLVVDHLSSGSLICPLPIPTLTAFAYYLVSIPEVAVLPKTVRFRHWLRAEATATVSEMTRIEPHASAGKRCGRYGAADSGSLMPSGACRGENHPSLNASD
jgi:DNA-binding transcriptional LysR family regulator